MEEQACKHVKIFILRWDFNVVADLYTYITLGFLYFQVHPSRKYFAVAEKGHKPNIILYEFPSLKPFRILRGD